MAHVSRLSEVGTALNAHVIAAPTNELDVRAVWYNVSSSVPETPAVLIEPQAKESDLYETGHYVINNFTVHFTVLHSRLDSEGVTNQECLALAEDLETLLHKNRTLNDTLVHSMVSSIELGLATRQKVTLRAARLVWQGFSRTRLGSI